MLELSTSLIYVASICTNAFTKDQRNLGIHEGLVDSLPVLIQRVHSHTVVYATENPPISFIHVCPCVSNEKERQSNLDEHPNGDKMGQICKHILILIILRAVVGLQVEDGWQLLFIAS